MWRAIAASRFSALLSTKARSHCLRACTVPLIRSLHSKSATTRCWQAVGATGRPVLVSTGVASIADIEETLRILRAAGSREVALLHCVSSYPAATRDMNLRAIDCLMALNCPVGLSDHSLGNLAATLAVARGASLIEKHFTISRADGGPDASFSLEPEELAGLVRAAREAWDALGDAGVLTRKDRPGTEHARSLFVVAPVAAGETLGPEHIRAIRPGLGLPPRSLSSVLGRRARRNIERGEPLRWEDIE